jgi:hypothetical protein
MNAFTPIAGNESPCENTDREIYRARPGDAYAPSVHVTASGALGIDVGGHVIVLSLERWHALGRLRNALADVIAV